MKLDQLKSSSKTKMELVSPKDDKTLLGVQFEGYTPDSQEWADKVAEIARRKSADNHVEIHKGVGKIPIDAQQNIADRNELMIWSITGIYGIEDFNYSDQAKINLLENPEYKWMLNQWDVHLDNRKNYWLGAQKSAPDGQNVEAG